LGLNTYAYGWRDYDPAIGRFNKMDRFSEKYFDMTPYQYGANNPVVFNDIKGDSILIHSKGDRILYESGDVYSYNTKSKKWDAYNGKDLKTDENGKTSIGGFLGQVVAALDQIRNGGEGGCQLITDLENASHQIRIKEGTENLGGATSVTWNPNETTSGPDINGGTTRPSFIGLAHELGHAHDLLDGKSNQSEMPGAPKGSNTRLWEYYAMHWENRVRAENNIPLRASYGQGYGQAIQSGTRNATTIFKNHTTPTIELRQTSNGIQPIVT
jgi:hypothetical protein